MNKYGATKRREFLVSAVAAGAVGITGCLSRGDSGEADRTPRFDFGGVIVSSRPQAEKYQPLDVSVTIDQAGEERYDETHTVEDVVHGAAVVVSEEWMRSRVPHTITVSTPVHDAFTLSTEKFDEEINDEFVDEVVYFKFALNDQSITIHPVPVEEKIDGSGE